MIKRESARLAGFAAVLAVVCGLTFSNVLGATGFDSVTYTLSVMAIICLFSHVIRRVLFPRIDLQALVFSSLKNPVGAAIAFASICFLLATVVASTVYLLK